MRDKSNPLSSQLCLAVVTIWMTQENDTTPSRNRVAKKLAEECRQKEHKTPEELIRELFGAKTNTRVFLKANVLVRIATAHKGDDVDREAFMHVLTECPLEYHAIGIARTFSEEFKEKGRNCPFPDFTIRDSP